MLRIAEDSMDVDETSKKSSATSPDSLSDESIVERVKAGDFASFELIMRRYNQRLFRIVRSIVQDDHEAEDVVQETYILAYEHLRQFEGRAKFSTWLTRIAVHEASRIRRRIHRARGLGSTQSEGLHMVVDSETEDAEAELSRSELGELLRQMVESLPTALRVVFTLRLVEGLSTDETAECLSLSTENVKIRLYRARSLLRQRIDERIGGEVRQLYQFDGERCDRIVQRVLSRLSPE